MNQERTVDRDAVKSFFQFRVNADNLVPLPTNYRLVLVVLLLGGALGGGIAEELAGAALGGLLAGGLALAFERRRIKNDLARRRKVQRENHDVFTSLASQTRRVQAGDVVKALLRVFQRTQIERSRLRVLEERYFFDQERSLLDEETLQERYGDLVNKSIRMISWGGKFDPVKRRVRWREQDGWRDELFFNPIRLVALFLTDTQLVICDVQIDSTGGGLDEQIQRIALSKVVNIMFRAERQRSELKSADILDALEQAGWSKTEIEATYPELSSKDAKNMRWLSEETTSYLGITRTDSGVLDVPIRSSMYVGRVKGPLDGSDELSDDELRIDRMLNELNRLVEHGPQPLQSVPTETRTNTQERGSPST